jgi:hypothetical protein
MCGVIRGVHLRELVGYVSRLVIGLYGTFAFEVSPVALLALW